MLIICIEVLILSLVFCFYKSILIVILMNLFNFLILKTKFKKVFFLIISLLFLFKNHIIKFNDLKLEKYSFEGKIKNNRLNIRKLDNKLLNLNILTTNLKVNGIKKIKGNLKVLKKVSNKLFLGRLEDFILKENFLRKYIKDIIFDLSYNNLIFNFFNSVLLGENLLDKETVNIFRESGLIHLLALSGLHFNILTNIISFLIAFFKLKKNQEQVVVFILLTSYFFTAQFSPSIFRAYLMCSFQFLSKALGEEINSLKSFYLAIIISLVIDHTTILDLSFQMSFLATLAIIISKFENKIVKSLAVTLFLAPIQIIYFKNLNISSIVYNFFFISIFEIIIKLSFLIVILKIFLIPNFLIEILLFVCYNLLKVTLLFLKFLLSYIVLNIKFKNLYLISLIAVNLILINLYFIWRFYEKIKRKVIRNS